MPILTSERILQKAVATYRSALGKNFVALTLQTDIHAAHYDIDYSLFVRHLDLESYERILKINSRLERKFCITLDLFLYEYKFFHKTINPWSAEIVKRNTVAVYGKNFWDTLLFKPSEIFQGAFVYLENNRDKFRRYIKNIGRQKSEWILNWALDHLFVAVKIYNSLFGFWSLGKNRNLLEFRRMNPRLAIRLEYIYRLSRYIRTNDEAIHYLALCYVFAEHLAVLARRRTLRLFIKAYKRKSQL